jgi:hypothetical protein
MLVAHHRSTWRFARRSATGSERAALPLVAAVLAARLLVALGREATLRATREWARRPSGRE